MFSPTNVSFFRPGGRALRAFTLGAFVLVCATAISPCRAGTSPDRSFTDDTRTTFDRLEKLGFAGVVVVTRDGKPAFTKGYGMADREHRVAWSPTTISTIGSITKQFTGAAILLLQERGKLHVTDSLPTYFDNVPDDKRAITVHQLLTHTSGIADLEDAGDFDPIERDDFIRRIFAQPLDAKPGEEYEYSNAGYSVLGAIIEKITGAPYEQFVRDNLFLPNHMNETGYILPKWDTKRVAHGYAADGPWGTILEKPMAADGPYWVLRANGGIHSTANDMLRWGNALLAGSVLSKTSMKSYWTPYVGEGGGSSYGYGWSIRTMENGDTVITHNGGNGIFAADMAIVPKQHLVAFLMTNVSSELPLVEGLLTLVDARLLDGTPYPPIPDVADMPESRMSALAGTYRFDDANAITVASATHGLELTPQGQKAFALVQSTRVVDLARCDDLSARINTLVAALVKGDYAPMVEAYDHRVTAELLAKHWNDHLREVEPDHGKLTGYDVVGTAMLREREMTLVRFHFEKADEDRAYVWDKDAEHHLLGVSIRGLAPVVRCVPVAGGGFASWDPRSGDSRPFRFETVAGQPVLRVVSGDQTFDAIGGHAR